jgi:cell division protein FtsB
MAYNRYQYETSPRKISPEYEPPVKKYPKKSTARKQVVKKDYSKNEKVKRKEKSKIEAKAKVKIIGCVAIGFMLLLAISYRNSVIDEKFAENKSLKSDLAALQKENEQLEANIESSLNLNNIEQSAKEMLGMQKMDSSQSVYISLQKEDYIEPASEEIVEEDTASFFEKIINFITGK